MAEAGIDAQGLDEHRREHVHFAQNLQEGGAEELLKIAFSHPIGLIANALGVPPPIMLEMGRRHGVPVAALVGAKEHAVRQVEAGVDIIDTCSAPFAGRSSHPAINSLSVLSLSARSTSCMSASDKLPRRVAL